MRSGLPADAVKLGRFIVDVNEPLQRFLDPKVDQLYAPLTTSTEASHRAKDAFSLSSLGYALSTHDHRFAASSPQEQSPNRPVDRLLSLEKPDLWLEAALRDEPVRRWVEGALRSTGNIYLIVGYRTHWRTEHQASKAHPQLVEEVLDVRCRKLKIDLDSSQDGKTPESEAGARWSGIERVRGTESDLDDIIAVTLGEETISDDEHSDDEF